MISAKGLKRLGIGIAAAIGVGIGAFALVPILVPADSVRDTVQAENPGHVATARDRAVQARSLHRDEHPQDLLGALIFLASAESDFVTGQTIAVDGGNVNT